MRNIIAVFLVLALAGSAMALQADFVGPIGDVAPSDMIRIDLIANGHVSGIMIDGIGDGKAGGYAADLSINAGFTVWSQVGDIASGDAIIEWVSGTAGVGLPIEAGAPLYSFYYHVPQVPDSTWITIGCLVDVDHWTPKVTGPGDVTVAPGAARIHVVPEPMTIALLGLGGLFLRGRK